MSARALATLTSLVLGGVATVALVGALSAPPRVAADVLYGLGRWREASAAERKSAADDAIRRTPGFSLLRMEHFGAGPASCEFAVVLHERTRLEFVLVPASERRLLGLGSGGAVAQPLFVARTECTRAAFLVGESSDLPVSDATWNGARDWCARMGLRLPTATEWAYCAKANGDGPWPPDPATARALGWFSESWERRESTPMPVALKPPNGVGLFDTLGNAREWVADGMPYDSNVAPQYQTEDSMAFREICGGSISDHATEIEGAIKRFDMPTAPVAGFRSCKTVGSDVFE